MRFVKSQSYSKISTKISLAKQARTELFVKNHRCFDFLAEILACLLDFIFKQSLLYLNFSKYY